MKITQSEVDAALDAVLKASGSALRYHTMTLTLENMRAAMRSIIEKHTQRRVDTHCHNQITE
jgi:hypothetical protein